jgi:hypothetical protein
LFEFDRLRITSCFRDPFWTHLREDEVPSPAVLSLHRVTSNSIQDFQPRITRMGTNKSQKR